MCELIGGILKSIYLRVPALSILASARKGVVLPSRIGSSMAWRPSAADVALESDTNSTVRLPRFLTIIDNVAYDGGLAYSKRKLYLRRNAVRNSALLDWVSELTLHVVIDGVRASIESIPTNAKTTRALARKRMSPIQDNVRNNREQY